MSAAADPPPAEHTPARFLTLEQIADELATSWAQVYALVRRKDLRATKIGGRGQWRVDRGDLEAYLKQTYTETSDWIDQHPFEGGDQESG